MSRILPLLVLLLTGCSSFPDLGGAATERARNAPYPRIAPISELLAAALAPGPTGEPQNPEAELETVADPLGARIDALRARAAILRGRPVNDETRAVLSGS